MDFGRNGSSTPTGVDDPTPPSPYSPPPGPKLEGPETQQTGRSGTDVGQGIGLEITKIHTYRGELEGSGEAKTHKSGSSRWEEGPPESWQK